MNELSRKRKQISIAGAVLLAGIIIAWVVVFGAGGDGQSIADAQAEHKLSELSAAAAIEQAKVPPPPPEPVKVSDPATAPVSARKGAPPTK